METKKSWREKLADSKGLPKVGQITGKMTPRLGTGTMVIPAPKERHLEAEGHKVFKRGKRYFVADFEKSLAFVRG
jgi:hypothetical protein